MPTPPEDPLVEVLAGFPAVGLAVLFGSAARGRTTRRSDLDVGVLLEPEAATTLWEIEGAVGEAVRRPVDLIDLRHAPPLLRFEIARDARVLLERQEGDWKSFRVRALLDWWDWAPTARSLHRLAIQRLRRKVQHGSA